MVWANWVFCPCAWLAELMGHHQWHFFLYLLSIWLGYFSLKNGLQAVLTHPKNISWTKVGGPHRKVFVFLIEKCSEFPELEKQGWPCGNLAQKFPLVQSGSRDPIRASWIFKYQRTNHEFLIYFTLWHLSLVIQIIKSLSVK